MFSPKPPVMGRPRHSRRWAMLLTSYPAKPASCVAAMRRAVSCSSAPNMTRGSSRRVFARHSRGTRSACAMGRMRYSTPSSARSGTCSQRSNRARRVRRGGRVRCGRAATCSSVVGQGRSASRFLSRASSASRRSSFTALPGMNHGPPSISTVIFSAVKGVPPVFAKLRFKLSVGSVRAGCGSASP